MSATKQQKIEQQEAIDHLRAILKPGDTVYYSVKHVSSSGMSRRIAFYIATCEYKDVPRITDITHYVGLAAGYKQSKIDGNLSVSGCGMNMGFAVIYDLSRTLYPEGFTCIGENRETGRWCPANDHSNGDRDYMPHLHPNAGGYALRYDSL